MYIKVMEMAQEWLVSKGLIADDKVTFKRFLHRMWFALYPRYVSEGNFNWILLFMSLFQSRGLLLLLN